MNNHALIPEKVKMVEVGPRDGLQNETQIVPIDVRVSLIEKLAEAGLSVIEAGSIVSPQKIPQMAKTAEVYRAIEKSAGVHYPVLIPNLRGLEIVLQAGVQEIAVFASASQQFSQHNINCSIDESLDRYVKVVELAIQQGLRVRAYLSCVLGCPYEGDISTQVVNRVARKLYQMGCYEISLGDTIGVGTPLRVQHLIQQVSSVIPVNQLAVHFHDSYGQALANIFAALQMGIAVIDSSVSGLGGCPYARGASGNVATEDVLYMLNGMHIKTGIEMDKLLEAGNYICKHLKREPASKVGRISAA